MADTLKLGQISVDSRKPFRTVLPNGENVRLVVRICGGRRWRCRRLAVTGTVILFSNEEVQVKIKTRKTPGKWLNCLQTSAADKSSPAGFTNVFLLLRSCFPKVFMIASARLSFL